MKFWTIDGNYSIIPPVYHRHTFVEILGQFLIHFGVLKIDLDTISRQFLDINSRVDMKT